MKSKIPVNKPPINKTNSQKEENKSNHSKRVDMEEYTEKVKQLFQYYCQLGDKMNLDILGNFFFFKLLNDCHLIDGSVLSTSPLSKTEMEIIYKSENKSNSMNFDQFLNTLVKISIRLYPRCKDKRKSTYYLIEDFLMPRYEDLFEKNNEADADESFIDVERSQSLIEEETIQKMIKKIAKNLFDIYRVYFPHEVSIADNLSYIKGESLKQFYVFLKDFGMFPELISKIKALAVYQSEIKPEVDDIINQNKDFYYDLISDVDLEHVSKFDSKNENILGQHFTFFKMIRVLVKIADHSYRKVELDSKEANDFNNRMNTIVDKFYMLLNRMEKSPGFIGLEKKTMKNHTFESVYLTMLMKDIVKNSTSYSGRPKREDLSATGTMTGTGKFGKTTESKKYK